MANSGKNTNGSQVRFILFSRYNLFQVFHHIGADAMARRKTHDFRSSCERDEDCRKHGNGEDECEGYSKRQSFGESLFNAAGRFTVVCR